MLLTEIDHVAVAVRDLEAAIDYYQRAIGAGSTIARSSRATGWRTLLKLSDSYIQLLTRAG